jgi:hypothetical protein
MYRIDYQRLYYECYMPRKQIDTGPIDLSILTFNEIFGGMVSAEQIERTGMGGLEKRLDYVTYH